MEPGCKIFIKNIRGTVTMTKKPRKKKEQKPIMIFTLDTETRGLEGDIFLCGLFGDNQYWESVTFDKLNKILRKYSLSYDVHIYIHNLDFDISKIAQDLKVEFLFSDSLIIDGIAATIKTFYFTFHDSLSLLNGSSLDTLCKDFQVENNKIDIVDRLLQDEKYHKYLVYQEEKKKKNIIPLHEEIEWIKLEENILDRDETKNKFFREIPPEDELLREYLEFDCRSLYEIIMEVIAASKLPLQDFVRCPTTASLSMRTFRTEFPDQYETATLSYFKGTDKTAEDFIREAYVGGRTEVFKSRLHDGFYYDVTSLYPYVMRAFSYPVDKYFMTSGGMALATWEEFLDFEEGGGIIEATVNIPDSMLYPILPYYCPKRGKLVFPVGTIKAAWTLHELKFAYARGVKIEKVHKVLFFPRMSSIFVGFVNYFEKVKNDNTEHIPGSGLNKKGEKINPSLRAYSKRILNSLYGKFASRRERKHYISKKELPLFIEKKKKGKTLKDELEFFNLVLEHGTEYAEEVFSQDEYQEKKMPLSYPHFDLEEEIFEYTERVESDFIQPQISCYVTSYARMHLYKAFETIIEKGGDIFYCDTDSIFTNKSLPPEMVDSSTFGKWKLEAEIKTGLFAQGKGYYLEEQDGKETKKFKGITKKIRDQFTRTDYENILQRQQLQDEDYLQMITDEDHIRNKNKFMSSIKQNAPLNKMRNILKGLYFRGEFDKRKLDIENNTSLPWKYHFEEEPEIDESMVELMEEAEADWNYIDPLSNMLQENKKMIIPNRNTKLYEIYKGLPEEVRRQYFSSKGTTSIQEISKEYEIFEEEILLSLENHYKMNA